MYQKIIIKLNSLADLNFAKWLRPYINLNENSPEKVLGIRVPVLRKLAKDYSDLDSVILEKLLQSNIHEAKELALFIMLIQNKKNPDLMCKLYLDNLEYINNWDLVDYTAPHIIAPNCDEVKLRELADSEYLWANRVAIVSTIYFIKQCNYKLALEFSEKFITHQHHLIHKACGWMLREIGKKDLAVLIDFLNKHSEKMPGVMKSYATEILRKKS